MFKPVIFSILLAATTFTVSAKYVTKISGIVDNPMAADTVMVIEDSAHPFFDRKWIIPVTEGKFSQEIETDYPMACYFIPTNQIRWWSTDWRFVAEGGDVSVVVTKEGDEPAAALDFSGPLSVKLRDFIDGQNKSPEALAMVGIGREMENDSAMREAVKKDGYPWVSLAEINDANYIWTKYGVPGAPGRIVLVDHEGTIVAIDPSVEELEQLIPRLIEKMKG